MQPPPLNPEILELLRSVSTATLSTQLYRRGFRNVFMRTLFGPCAPI